MSYLHTIEYTLQPVKSYVVIHNCSGCGSKSSFINTNRFRVNANGNKLDVWLIYQCSKCKHTLNVAIYERIKSSAVSKEEYVKFLQNDEKFAQNYGKHFLFSPEINWWLIQKRKNMNYLIVVSNRWQKHANMRTIHMLK